MMVAGIGCRKGVAAAEVLAAVEAALAANGLDPAALSALATTAFKRDEEGIAAAARRLGRLWAIGLVLDGFTLVLYLFADSLAMLNVATFIHALPIPLLIVSRATIIQRLVPTRLLGRAFGYIDIAVNGVLAISAGVTGIVAAEIGPLLTIVYGSALAGVVGLVALALPSVREIEFEERAGGGEGR